MFQVSGSEFSRPAASEVTGLVAHISIINQNTLTVLRSYSPLGFFNLQWPVWSTTIGPDLQSGEIITLSTVQSPHTVSVRQTSPVSSQTWWNFEPISCPAELRPEFVCLKVPSKFEPPLRPGKYQTQIKTFGEIQPTLYCRIWEMYERSGHCSRIGHYIDLASSQLTIPQLPTVTQPHWPISFQNQAPPWWKDPLMGPAFPSGWSLCWEVSQIKLSRHLKYSTQPDFDKKNIKILFLRPASLEINV